MKIKLRLILLLSIFIFAIISFNSCFTFRQSDKSAIKKFHKKGLVLHITNIIVSDRNLHFASVGDDSLPTLFFVHGSPGGWIDFKRYLKDTILNSKFRVISIDRPGFGYSNYGEAMHLQFQADLIGAILKKIDNGKPLYIIGHSYGGPLVALLAADYPLLVSRVVILAGALDPALEPKEKWRPYFIKPPFRSLLPGAGQQANEELWYLKQDLKTLKDKLSLIHCPLFVLHAKNDMLVDFRNTAYIKKEFTSSDVQIITFENGNHFIPFNKQKQIDSLLLSFLK